jgi:hypothetical protein
LYQAWIESGLLPERIETPQQAMVTVQAGKEYGLAPMFALNHVFVVKGAPSLDGKSMTMIARARGFLWRTIEDFTSIKQKGFVPEFVNYQTIIEMWHCSHPETVDRTRFTLGDALKAGIMTYTGGARKGETKETWNHYPAYMVWWRCFSKLANRSGAVSALLPEEMGIDLQPYVPQTTNFVESQTQDEGSQSLQSATENMDRLQERSVPDQPDDTTTPEKRTELPDANGEGTTVRTGQGSPNSQETGDSDGTTTKDSGQTKKAVRKDTAKP